MRYVIVGMVVLVAGAGLYFSSLPAGPDAATLARILGRQGECVRLLADFSRLGVVKRVVRDGADSAFVYVDAGQWATKTSMERLTESLTIYCALTPPNGYMTITTRTIEGENVFRIQNGHVVSWF